MHPRPSRAAGVVVAALAVGVLPLLPASPVAAADPVERRWTVTDTNADGLNGLLVGDDLGYQISEPGIESHVFGLSASRDGSRVIYVRWRWSTTGVPQSAQVVVRDASTQEVRVLDSLPLSGSRLQRVPQLSADGTKAVWEEHDESSNAVVIRKAAVAGGAASTLATGGFSPYAFLDDSTVLLQDLQGNPFTMPYAGGTKSPVIGLPVEALDVTVSPDGSHVAYGLYDSTVAAADPEQADMQVAPLSVVDGVATVGAAVTLLDADYNSEPAFSRDGARVTWAREDGAGGEARLWSAPADGSAPATSLGTSTPARSGDVAFTSLPSDDTTTPGPTSVPGPFVLGGTRATVGWTLPDDADLSGVRIKRVNLSDGWDATTYVPSGSTSFVDSGLLIGTSYRYDIAAVDRYGHLGPVASRTMTAAQALATFQDPTSRTTVRAPFPVRFAAAAASTVKYTVDYSINGGGYRAWVNDLAGVQRTFGTAAGTGLTATASTPGQTYRFRVVGRDAYGNSTAGVVSGKAVVPFDQTRAALSGGGNVGRGDAWLGTLRLLNRATHYARIAVTGDRFQVIGERCPSCGVLDVYDGATRIASVDTRAAARQPRQVLYTRVWSTASSHTMTVKPRGTAGRPSVYLDGFAVRR